MDNLPNRLFRNLILLGTVHRDPRGMARLSEFYGSYGPDCILLEFSRHGLTFREKNQVRLQRELLSNLRQVSRESGIDLNTLLRHPRVSAIRRQISLPFEYRASRRYALAMGIPFFLIDHSPFSSRWTRVWPELTGRRNLRFLVSSPPEPRSPCSRSYEQAACLMGTGGARHSRFRALPASSSECEWVKREQHLARKTVAILSKCEPRRPVFVGGWRHLLRGEYQATLRDYLGIHAHQCVLLDRVFFMS